MNYYANWPLREPAFTFTQPTPFLKLTPEIAERIWTRRFGLYCEKGNRRFQALTWQLHFDFKEKLAGWKSTAMPSWKLSDVPNCPACGQRGIHIHHTYCPPD